MDPILQQALQAVRQRPLDELMRVLARPRPGDEGFVPESGQVEPVALLENLIGMRFLPKGGASANLTKATPTAGRAESGVIAGRATSPQVNPGLPPKLNIPYPEVDDLAKQWIAGKLDTNKFWSKFADLNKANPGPSQLADTTGAKMENILHSLDPEYLKAKSKELVNNMQNLRMDLFTKGEGFADPDKFIQKATRERRAFGPKVIATEHKLNENLANLRLDLMEKLAANANAKQPGTTQASRMLSQGFDPKLGMRQMSASVFADEARTVLPKAHMENAVSSNPSYPGTFVEFGDTLADSLLATTVYGSKGLPVRDTLVAKAGAREAIFDPLSKQGMDFLQTLLEDGGGKLSTDAELALSQALAAETSNIARSNLWQSLETPQLMKAIKDAGYSGVRTHEYSGGTEMYFKPSDLKSYGAAFDPELQALENYFRKDKPHSWLFSAPALAINPEEQK